MKPWIPAHWVRGPFKTTSMNTQEMIPTVGILSVYCLAHGLVVAGLLRARRSLPSVERSRLSVWTLVATAAPVIGSLFSIWVFARLARAYQRVLERAPGACSDRGYAAGIGYGVTSTLAAWTSNSGVGFLCLCCLGVFFVQVELAIRSIRRRQLEDGLPESPLAGRV